MLRRFWNKRPSTRWLGRSVRLLADENVPGLVVQALRERGHDVAWIAEGSAGMADTGVLAIANEESRLLITLDTDFGYLAFGADQPAETGIMLFRLGASSPAALAIRVVAIMESREDWAGHFSVVGPGRTRMRRLPGARGGH